MADNLNVNALDFDLVKQELITYLGTQNEFNDYDFTGSAFNTLLDVCAYLIHYVGIQANFSLREAFLDSAQLRKNVVARAKELGYFPSQWKASRTTFKLTYTQVDPDDPILDWVTEIIVPKGTTFVSTLEDGSSITFVTYDDNPLVDVGIAAGLGATGVLTGTVFVAQGIYASQYWTVVSDTQRFQPIQERIDTDFLDVTVKPTKESSSITSWQYVKTVTTVGPTTESYFLSEDGTSIEIYFGNDVIGKKLVNGNYVGAEYLITEGALGNGLKKFALTKDISSNSISYDRNRFIFDEDIAASADGADRENLSSIRLLAPLSYQRQNRIVTAEDYKAAVLEAYQNIRAVNVWGGEDADPPEFGKVFVSVAPLVGLLVSPTTKKSIETNILSRFNVVGINPEIVDPDYLEVNLITTVYYNKNRTTLKASEIGTNVKNTVKEYFSGSIFDYNQSFKYSKFLADVDATHASIVNSLAEITIAKEFATTGNRSATYIVKLNNAVEPSTCVSNIWLDTSSRASQLKDNGSGKIDFWITGGLVKSNVGTVDYDEGTIELPGFNPRALTTGQKIKFTCVPVLDDVSVKHNNLVVLGTNITTVIAVDK